MVIRLRTVSAWDGLRATISCRSTPRAFGGARRLPRAWILSPPTSTKPTLRFHLAEFLSLRLRRARFLGLSRLTNGGSSMRFRSLSFVLLIFATLTADGFAQVDRAALTG